MNQKILGIIPARYASTRFPAKALVNILGKPMIQRVYEQSSKARRLSELLVATDDPRIEDAVHKFGGKVVMTSKEHGSGTERCAEAVKNIGIDVDYVINIQGDEPFIKPEQIDELASLLDGETEIASMVSAVEDYETLYAPSEMKVVLNNMGYALYFSREPIPHVRGKDKSVWLDYHTFYKHVAIYAYRTDVLKSIVQLAPTDLEMSESLEQLRWMQNGYAIKIGITKHKNLSIDTPEDLERALKTMV